MRNVRRWVLDRVGFPRPNLPLRNLAGIVVMTYEDWARHAREARPLRFWLYETVPRCVLARGIKLPEEPVCYQSR
jgi:hypothetical protein